MDLYVGASADAQQERLDPLHGITYVGAAGHVRSACPLDC